MQIVQGIAVFFILAMGVFWTLLPCGFGLHNFIKSHNTFLGWIARIGWASLLGMHFLLAYFFWFESASYLWLFALVAAHVLFLVLFGRDLGTS